MIFLIFALQCLFPIFETTPADYVGLSIVNPDVEVRDFTITARAPNGSNAQTGRVTLTGGAQRAFLLNEILPAPAATPGSIRIDSAAGGCTSYLSTGNNESLAGTDADVASSANILLPHISVNTGFTELANTETTIAVVNGGTILANVTAQLVNLNGSNQGSTSFTISANGSFTARISELFRDALPTNGAGGKRFDGYLRLSADVPISAWQRVDTPLSRAMLRGQALPAPLATTVMPHFIVSGDYGSFINLVNPGSVPTLIELEAFDDRGARIGELVPLTLQAGEARRTSVLELFRVVTILTFPPPTITGYIYIRPIPTLSPASQQLVADLEIAANGSSGKVASMLYPANFVSSPRWTLPFALSSQPYFTGWAVGNLIEILTVQNDVVVEVVNSSGVVVDRTTISLSPQRRQIALIPPNLSSGYVRFLATFPIHVIGAIGTTNLRVLDQVPAVAR